MTQQLNVCHKCSSLESSKSNCRICVLPNFGLVDNFPPRSFSQRELHKLLIHKLLSLNPPDVYVDFHVGNIVESVKIDTITSLEVLTLNVILVLEGKRLAYRESTLVDLIPTVLEIAKGRLVSLPLIPSEPLIVLKENVSTVLQYFYTNDLHIAFGIVLGYAYTGEDWIGSNNHYSVSYVVGKSHLYTFNLPMSECTSDMKAKIIEDLDKYRTSLSFYGYAVDLAVFSYSSGRLTPIVLV